MRRTLGPRHKALVTVGGMSMLDRNLAFLIAHGIRDITVVTAIGEAALEGAVMLAARRLAARGICVRHHLERTPLGNIGVVEELASDGVDLLVIYVDNLCPLDLAALIARHRLSGAAMTIATHIWDLRNPFGELTVTDGFVEDYLEKPVRSVRISSGTCVLTAAAARAAPAGLPCSAGELFARLIRTGQRVAAFEHTSPWVDINDANALLEAEKLACACPDLFA